MRPNPKKPAIAAPVFIIQYYTESNICSSSSSHKLHSRIYEVLQVLEFIEFIGKLYLSSLSKTTPESNYRPSNTGFSPMHA